MVHLSQVLHTNPGPYLAVRRQLVGTVLHYATATGLSQVRRLSSLHPLVFQPQYFVFQTSNGDHVPVGRQKTIRCSARLAVQNGFSVLPQETAHTALALMDRTIMCGVHVTDHLHTLFACACLRLAAFQDSAPVPSHLALQAVTDIPGASAS